MTSQKVTIDEIWALAKEHAKSLNRERSDYLPTIDNDKKVIVEGQEVFFHIDNDPAIYYSVSGVDDLVYVDCDVLYKWDRFEGVNSSEIISSSDELRERIKKTIKNTY
jgi:hypothetical protein